MATPLGKDIQSLDFDHPFTIDADGNVHDAPGEFAPSVYHSDDIEIDDAAWSGAIRGMTGQYGYAGHVMHPSEFIGDAIARELFENNDAGTVFAVVTVEVWPTDDDPGPDPAGWTIVRKER